MNKLDELYPDTGRFNILKNKMLNSYITLSEEDDALRNMKDVFVTDHVPKPKKYHTNNPNEDR